MVMGLKTNETRSWDTNYQGPLLIHATKNMPRWCEELIFEEPFKSLLYDPWAYDGLPQGKIIGQVEVVGTQRTDVWLSDKITNGKIDPEWANEFAFGDYSGGRFAWQTINPVRFDKPIPAKGSQGFWNFDIKSIPGFV